MNLKLNSNKETKNEKKQIWMYALILFTGAFIVLLLTAYSQVKFQNNISEYQSKLSSQEKAKINAVTDFNSAVKENKRLKDEIDSLREKLIESEKTLAAEEEKYNELKIIDDNEKSTAEMLMKAQSLYINEDYVGASALLRYDIKKDMLSETGIKLYNELIEKSFPKASQQLYREGYKNYKKKDYFGAITSLSRSIDFAKNNEYYIDDAYYYLANSYYKLSDYAGVKKTAKMFYIVCPYSSFTKDMQNLEAKVQ